jgi:hypothetical protein
VAGGLLGYAAGWIAARPWTLPARIAVIVVVLGLGFFTLWMLASARFLVDWVLGVQGA